MCLHEDKELCQNLSMLESQVQKPSQSTGTVSRRTEGVQPTVYKAVDGDLSDMGLDRSLVPIFICPKTNAPIFANMVTSSGNT